METPVHLPLPLVMTPQALPRCCTRHGRPVAEWKSTEFSSRPPAWAWVMVPFSFLIGLIVILVIRRQVSTPAWPYCGECVAMRRRRLTYAFGGGPICLVLSMVIIKVHSGGAIGAMGVIGVVLGTPIIMIVFGDAASWPTLARGVVTGNGTMLTIKNPAPNFVASLPPVPAYPTYPVYQAYPAYPPYPAQPAYPPYPAQPAYPPYPVQPAHPTTAMPAPYAPSAPPQFSPAPGEGGGVPPR